MSLTPVEEVVHFRDIRRLNSDNTDNSPVVSNNDGDHDQHTGSNYPPITVDSNGSASENPLAAVVLPLEERFADRVEAQYDTPIERREMSLTPVEEVVHYRDIRRLNSDNTDNSPVVSNNDGDHDQHTDSNYPPITVDSNGSASENPQAAVVLPLEEMVADRAEAQCDTPIQRRGPGEAANYDSTCASSAHGLSKRDIYEACRIGDPTSLRALLRKAKVKRAINKLDKYKYSPLHYAVLFGNSECTDILLSNGADMHVRGGGGNMTPQQILVSEKIVSFERNARYMDPLSLMKRNYVHGRTSLHLMSSSGNFWAVKTLLYWWRDLECKDDNQMTPLHVAALAGFEINVNKLLDRGADIIAKDKYQNTPLHLAVAEGHLQVCKSLLEWAAEKENGSLDQLLAATDSNSRTALYRAVESNRLAETALLLEYGARAHERNEENFVYPLHLAAENGELEMLNLIYERAEDETLGSDTDILNVRNKGDETPLHKAVAFNRKEAVEFLLSYGSNIEAVDRYGFSPLLVAARKGHNGMTELLLSNLSNKADFTISDAQEKNILHWAADSMNIEHTRKLMKMADLKDLLSKQNFVGNTPLHIAARNGSADMIKLFCEEGGDLSLKNEDGQTALHQAAVYGRTATVRAICELDDDLVDIEDLNKNTAIHLAAEAGHENVVSLLISYRADVGSRNMDNWSPLEYAAANGRTKIARILLENRVPVDGTEKSSITPLYLACENNHPETVKLLLGWKASLGIKCTSERKNPLDIAIESQSKKCVEIILSDKNWMDGMRNRTAENIEDFIRLNTPMRKLIRSMPDMALKALNNCILPDKEHSADDNDFSITYIYEFIDDDYSMTNWLPEQSGPSVRASVDTDSTYATSDDSSLPDSCSIRQYMSSEAERYTDSVETLTKNHPVSVMASCKAEHLMSHPLFLPLIDINSELLYFFAYFVGPILFILYLGFLTDYMMKTKPKHFWNDTTNSTLYDYVSNDTTNSTLDDYVKTNEKTSYALWFICAFAILNLVKEVLQVRVYEWRYFTSPVNWVEVSCFILALLLVVPTICSNYHLNTPENWQWQCGAVSICFAWINFALLVQKHPLLGTHVIIFTHVLGNLIKHIFLVYIFVIIGFGLGFYALLQNQSAFETWYYAIIKTGVMMTGEFEYTKIFFEEGAPTGSWEVVTRILFVVFAIVMTIAMMNLLIGLTLHDIKDVADTASHQRRVMEWQLVLRIRHMLPKKFRKKFIVREEKIYPNRKKISPWSILGILGTLGILDKRRDGPTIVEDLEKKQRKEPMDVIISHQEKMMNQLKPLDNVLKDVERMQMWMKSLAAKHGVELNEDDYVGEVLDEDDEDIVLKPN